MSNICIHLKQHIGAPCTPIVRIGDKVSKGMLIATPNGLGANIFSSVYGIVEDVLEDSIIIKPDEKQKEKYLLIKKGSNAEMVREAGVVGMGGAGFPTAVKLDTSLNGGYILVNAAECEPGLCHNTQQIETSAEMTVRGLKYCMEISNANKGVFAIKAKNEKAVKALQASLAKEENISIHLLPDIYPMGEERAVVREVLGKLLQPTELPSAADAVVINVETILRVVEAIELRKPCFSKNITVNGNIKGAKKPFVFMDVPIGTSIGDLLERAGGIEGGYGEILIGGPFTGKSCSLDEPITKTSGGIFVTSEFPNLHQAPVGLLVCACGGSESRLQELAEKMNAAVVSTAKCKQATDVKGALKCENPGNCPGQAEKCLQFRKSGAEYVIIGNCSDCSNTVMGSAPKLKLKVFHQTDHVMRAIGQGMNHV